MYYDGIIMSPTSDLGYKRMGKVGEEKEEDISIFEQHIFLIQVDWLPVIL